MANSPDNNQSNANNREHVNEQEAQAEAERRQEVIRSLDSCLVKIKNTPENERTDRENWIIKAVEDARARTLDQGADTFTVELDGGLYREAEGIPVDELVDYLTEKSNSENQIIEAGLEERRHYNEAKDKVKFDWIKSDEKHLDTDHQEKMAWHRIYDDLPPNDPLRIEIDDLRNSWRDIDRANMGNPDFEYNKTDWSLQTGQAFKEVMSNRGEDLNQRMVDLDTLHGQINTLEENSALFSEIHQDAWNNPAKRESRIKYEASLISNPDDYRKTGDHESDYYAAEAVMNKRRELVSGKQSAEAGETAEPETFNTTPSPDTNIDQTPKPEDAVSDRYILNYVKMVERNPNMSAEEREKYIKTAEIDRAREELRSEIDGLVDSMQYETPDQDEIDRILGELAAKTKMPVEDKLDREGNLVTPGLRRLYDAQQANIEQMAQRQVEASKKGWKKFATMVGRSGAYLGAGLGIGIATGGLGWITGVGFAGLSGVRVFERWVATKLNRSKVNRQMEEIRSQLAASGNNDLKSSIYENMVAQIATQRQAEIDQLVPAMYNLDDQLDAHEGRFVQVSNDKRLNEDNRQAKIEEIRSLMDGIKDQRSDQRLVYLMDYLKNNQYYNEGLDQTQKLELSERILALESIDDQNRLLERVEEQKSPQGFRRLVNWWDKKFGSISSKISGKHDREKVVSASVMASLGLVAKEVPVLRNVLMGLSGVQGGEAIGNWLGTKGRFKNLRQIRHDQLRIGPDRTLEDMQEDVRLARAQVWILRL